MRLSRRNVACIQGAYYGATALWPLLSRRTFEAATGHKDEWWLVETVALLLVPVGGALGAAGARDRVTPEIALLGAGAAGLLGASDVLVAARRRGRWTYLLDAAASGAILVAWGAASRRPRSVDASSRKERARRYRPRSSRTHALTVACTASWSARSSSR